MKIGHTLFFETAQTSRNATVYRDTAAHIEGAVLVTVAIIGGLGNLLIFGVTATCSRFRTSSCAFLSHQCILDSLKSIFCIPFACALLLDKDIPYCNALGATYIFLMTLTAYNLLAIHCNEEYQLTERHGFVPGLMLGNHYCTDKENSFWCVSFGIFMIWFTTILLHLGVAFLPSSAEFNYDIGNCVFNYGTPKNYVIHVLWTILVTAALVIAIICFAMFFRKLRKHMHSEKWTLLHKSISNEFNHIPGTSRNEEEHGTHHQRRTTNVNEPQEENTEELHYEFADEADQIATHQMKLCLRRVVVMLLMVISFLLFWYPLFILTILDVNYSRPPQEYRICMIIAWTHPVTTPLFCGIIYFDMIHMQALTRSVYSAALPMKDSTSFSSVTFQRDEPRNKFHHRYKMYDVGFTNDNFSFSNQGSPSHMRRDADLQGLPCEGHRSAGHPQHDTMVHTLPPSLPHSILSEGQEFGVHHSCSAQDSYQTLIM